MVAGRPEEEPVVEDGAVVPRDTEDHRLHPVEVQSIQEMLGVEFEVDLFASHENAHCTVHYTKLDSAFEHQWLNKAFYANPPFESPELIVSAFSKAVAHWEMRPKHTSFTFILPRWTTAPWWPSKCEYSARFEIVREYPTGSDLFTAPNPAGGDRISLGVTRWPVVVFHLAKSLATVTDASKDLLAHIRLGHPGGHVVPLMLDAGQAPGMRLGPASRRAAARISETCPVCRVAKAVRPPAKPTEREGSTEPFHTLFVDTTGPFVTGCEGSMYAVGAVDDRTGWAFVLPVPSREGKVAADALQAIEASVASLMAYAGLRVGGEEPAVIRILQTDNAAEFRGGAFAKLCKKRGIAQRFTSAYLHQNNSFVEGVWRDILNGTRALLLGAKLPKEFWPHAMRHYTFIRNRTPKVGRLQGISPYQVLFRTPPDMSRLKTFGCTAYQYLDYDQRSEDIPSEEFSPPASMVEVDTELSPAAPNKRYKLADRATSMLYVGQCENSTAYKLVHRNSPHRVRRCGMVVFNEESVTQHATDTNVNPDSKRTTHMSTDFDMAMPEGTMLEREALKDEPFTVFNHRAYHHLEDNEIYAIFYVKSDSHPGGIWATADHLLTAQPQNCEVVLKYLRHAILPGHANPYYPLFVEGQVKEWFLRAGTRRTKASESYQKCLVVGFDPNVASQENIQVITLEPSADIVDVPRSEVQVAAPPNIALVASPDLQAQTITEPKSLKQVERAPDRIHWKEAMQKELNSLESKGTFDYITQVPAGKKAILTAFKFKLKWKKNGELERRKARLIAHGQNQTYGIDYTDVFAPSSQLTSVNILLVLAVNMDLTVYHIDVVTAFLNATLDAEVYLSLPDGRLARARKSIYGLKQGAHDWFQLSNKVLLGIPGMQRSKVETCWYYLVQGNLTVFILCHVDDYMLATNSPSWKEWFVNYFEKHFEINDLGVLDQVVGIGVTWGDKSVALSRERAIKETIQRFRMDNAKQVAYPIESGFSLELAAKCDATKPFLNLLGELRYHQRSVRPDLSTALAYLSRYSSAYDERHFEALKRVLRYLIGTASTPLILTKGLNRQHGVFDFTMFTDATWADCKETKVSTSGWAIFLNGSPVLSASTKQKCVALSSTQAEIIALSEGCKDLVYLTSLLEAFVEVEKPMVVFVDNQATIALMQQPVNNSRTKHIAVRHFWVRDLVQSGEIVLRYVPTEHNVADFLTKPLQGERFRRFRNQLLGMF